MRGGDREHRQRKAWACLELMEGMQSSSSVEGGGRTWEMRPDVTKDSHPSLDFEASGWDKGGMRKDQ